MGQFVTSWGAPDLPVVRGNFTEAQKVAAEFLGTAGLLAAIVGSGIMAERLANENAAITLLANSIATGAALLVLIYGLEHISGAHFNPAVTLIAAVKCETALGPSVLYIAGQFFGGVFGVVLANLMFGLPAVNISAKARTGPGQLLAEAVATFGLIGVISMFSRRRAQLTGAMVACYITAAYWFTSSTSFANPAVRLARALSNTFAGIAPASVVAFVAAQLLGATGGFLAFRWLDTEQNENG